MLLSRLWCLIGEFRHSIDANSARCRLCKLLVGFNGFLLLLSTSAFVCTFFADHLRSFRPKRLVEVAPAAIMTCVQSSRLSLVQVIDELSFFTFVCPDRRCSELVIGLCNSRTASSLPLSVVKISSCVILSVKQYRF